MKTEDFERLKAKLGDEFTAEYRVEKDSVMVLVRKKRVEIRLKYDYMNVGEYYLQVFIDNGHEKYSTIGKNRVTSFLTQQLEKYLNNEIE